METCYSSSLLFFINGKKHELNGIDPRTTLLQYLKKIGLTGTKLGCGEGGCGACTVMLSKYDQNMKELKHLSANACLTPLCALDGYAVTTVEGIGGMKQGLHPVQRRIAQSHGSQCGFCTPGIVMAVYAQLRSKPDSTPHDIEEALDGNLCRCTGYRPILDAAKSLSNNKGSAGGGCCQGKAGEGCPCKSATNPTEDTTPPSNVVHHTTEQAIANQPSLEDELKETNYTEPIFPPLLMTYTPAKLHIQQDNIHWFQPTLYEELLALKQQYPHGKIVVGNTELGIETKFKNFEYTVLINPVHIPELQIIQYVNQTTSLVEYENQEGVVIGAAVSINRVRAYFLTLAQEQAAAADEQMGGYKTRGYLAIAQMLHWFASNHIRNVASIGGNIITASPISDLNPMLLATKAILKTRSQVNGTRYIPIDQFFLAYRKVNLQADEILESIFIPMETSPFTFVIPLKQARRREDDISIVTSGMSFTLKPITTTTTSSNNDATIISGLSSFVIEDCILAFGGLAPKAIRANKTAAQLIGSPWSLATIESCFTTLKEEIFLSEQVPGGQAAYRMSLALSFLFKAYCIISQSLNLIVPDDDDVASTTNELLLSQEDVLTVGYNFVTAEKNMTSGAQTYSLRTGGLTTNAATNEQAEEETSRGTVGQNIPHQSAHLQVTGEAKYTSDMPLPSNTLHAALVMSTKAHATILSIDISQAKQCAGFVAYYDAKDVLGSNSIGPIIKDEHVFEDVEIKHFSSIIGIIVAQTHEQALFATKKVSIVYEELPVILSIADAIENQSFYPEIHSLSSGNLAMEQEQSDYEISGKVSMGGQEHFYLETNCSLVLPQDFGGLEIYTSTQNCMKTQNFCASVCGIPSSKVIVKCKRMGGAFGGKETRSVFLACTVALAAYRLQQPVLLNIERDIDMSITGQRHAFQVDYTAGCTKDGKLTYLSAHLYSNIGYSLDLSLPVMDRALFHADNCYSWPAMELDGTLCITNQPSHTAFRGFGGPQGLFLAETVMDHLSHVSGISSAILRKQNLYQEGNVTHFQQKLEDFYIPRLWDNLLTLAEVRNREKQIELFNTQHRYRKRGLAMLPTKFGISFTAKFMNQGGALVHVYIDGSVLVAHGGTEMGQGLHTKIIQIVSECFHIPIDKVIVQDTSTNTVPNSSPTAASASTDLYGMAVLQACEDILIRLLPLKQRNPSLNNDWKALVTAAYFERIDLSAHGFFATDGNRCGYNWQTHEGTPFNYFTQGVACSEVEIDCLTGDFTLLRSDILMDVGKSINPGLDIGQIEGAFVQGYGWCTMEELIWGDAAHPWVTKGQLFTRGPGTYKIPAFNDIPIDFRIHLADTDNKFAIHSSKAIGEPPFFLGVTVFFAIKQAIMACRTQYGYNDYYPLDLPATSERIRMACMDPIATLCVTDKENASQFKPKGSY